MSFSVTMLLGNNKGKIGIGTAKGDDVPKAIDKAKKEARYLVPALREHPRKDTPLGDERREYTIR